MANKLSLVTVTLSSILLLTACGSSGSKESNIDKLKKRNAIYIVHHVSEGRCSLENFKDVFVNPDLYTMSDSASCLQTFDRTMGSTLKGSYCREYASQDGGNIACIVGFDDFKAAKAAKPMIDNDMIINLEDRPSFNEK